MSSPQSSLRHPESHIHLPGQKCPTCDQSLPPDQVDLVRQRIEKQHLEIVAREAEKYAAEKTKIEAEARAAGVKQTQEMMQAKIDAADAAKVAVESETRKKVEELTAQIAEKEAAARAAGAKEAETALGVKVVAAEQARALAEIAKAEAERQNNETKQTHETILNERLQEQREILDKATATAVLAAQAKTFGENQKLQEKVQDLQRQLEKQSNHELGEGAEIVLYDELCNKFEGDRIREVPPGANGADIVHEIIENGQLCGKIIYDSKNRKGWLHAYATKLCEDKLSESADFAILSTLKFPKDAKQLDVREGVIIANPARVVAVAELLRDVIVQTHGLRLSKKEREKKQGEVFAYIMSERFQQQLNSIETKTDKLLELDVIEHKAHQKVWRDRGALLKDMQKAHGTLTADIARIIGTGEAE